MFERRSSKIKTTVKRNNYLKTRRIEINNERK